jgi:hypothetical protein
LIFNMSKRSKILSILMILAFGIAFFLIFSPIFSPKKAANYPVTQNEKLKKIDPAKIEEDYQAAIKIKFSDFYDYLNSSANDLSKLRSIRDSILSLRVPKKYKGLHYSLVLAIDKLENFELLGKMDDKNESNKIVQRIRIENKWIL